MESFPHHYRVKGRALSDTDVSLVTEGAPELSSAPPVQFGGSGEKWSPESLLVAAVSDCFILTFKAIARASKLDWLSVECEVEGILEKQDKAVMFTEFHIRAVLVVKPGVKPEFATRLLEKAEHTCLITNSLKAKSHLATEIKDGC